MSRETAIQALKLRVAGQVLLPGEERYDEARHIWNAMIDRRPAVIVQATSTSDALAAIEAAREIGTGIAVRGGGHHVAGSSVIADGVMLDLEALRTVRVDADTQIAHAQGGALMQDLDRAAQEHGLAVPGGVVSTTGIGGLTLGGGFGWLARKHGLAADNLVSAQVLTADGQIRTASADRNAELFWALRGGGGNFGVVTSFEFRLHPLAGAILFGPTLHRYEDAAMVLRRYRDFCSTAPRECCVWADIFTAPPLPFLPEEFHGSKVLSLLQSYAGDPSQGERVLAPLRGFGQPIADAVGPTPYATAQTILDATYPQGARNYWSSQNYAQLKDDTIDAVIRLAEDLPTAESDILFCQLGGAIDDVAPTATAYPHRGVQAIVTPGARWHDPADDERCVSWTRHTAEALAPGSSGGAYANFIAETRGVGQAAYGANLERLRAAKRRYDPDNLFRSNQNLSPP